jgi:hypothetical protein
MNKGHHVWDNRDQISEKLLCVVEVGRSSECEVQLLAYCSRSASGDMFVLQPSRCNRRAIR